MAYIKLKSSTQSKNNYKKLFFCSHTKRIVNLSLNELKLIAKVRRNLYEIENKKNLSKSKIKKIEKNILELEESFSKLKKYYDYYKIEYKGIRDVRN